MIAASRNVSMKRKIMLLIAAGATVSVATAAVVIWLGFSVLTRATENISEKLSVVSPVDLKACLTAVSELSTPGYWLESTLEKTLDETLARCRSEPAGECRGDACLDSGKKVSEAEA